MTNNKLCHRVLALVMAGILCASAFPVTALAEDESGNLSAVTLPLDWDTVDVGSATPETGVQQEESSEEQTEDQDEEPLPEPSADAATSEDTVPLPEMPDVPSAAEKCAAYAHLSDAGGVCTVCGADLKAEFTALYNAIDSASFSAKMNAWGWYEQHLDAQDAASVAAYEQAEAEGQTAYAALQDARDVFDCLELAVEELPEELYAMLLDLYAIWQSGQATYQYPQDPAIFGQANGTDGLTDDILWGDLPDAPTGSYIGSRGLPVATGETKIGISAWTTQLYGGGGSYLDAAALNNDGLTVQVARESGKSYAVVPIMVQVEYPENDSSSYISLPEGVEVLRYHSDAEPASDSERDSILYDTYLETSAAASGFFVRADADFTAAFTYVDAAGNATTKTLRVVVSDSADAALQTLGGSAGGAATLADRPTPTVTSGVITKIQYVVDTWLIWFNGQEAYCCSHGLQGKVEGCPTYSYAYTSILAPGQYTGDHYTTQVSVWGGLGQLSVGTLTEQHSDAYSESAFYLSAASTYSLAEEALLETCYRYYDDIQMYIITHYPESEAAQIYLASAQAVMSGAETLASDTGYYTYIYTPPISGWQTIAVIGPPTDEDAEEPVTPEYYADWSAPPQTASGELTFDYRIQVDKYQLDTKEKVDGAVIDLKPLETSGTIDGGSWRLAPTTKQTVTTSGHTSDDNFQQNGGAAFASWTLHYDVTKTSSSRSGSVGPYSSQEEADDAAASARANAVSALQAEAQNKVTAALAAAQEQLNTLQFTYNEITVPYGYIAYSGSNGSSQTISVTQGTDGVYPMQNDEWGLKVRIEKTDSETHRQIAGDAVYEVYEWDTVTQQYIPYGGYNQYKVERQEDGTYKVVNHSAYATTPAMQEMLYYTQRNEGRFLLVETQAPARYYGDWNNVEQPGTAGTPLGKRAYFIEITKAKDGSTIWLDNADYNAAVSTKYTGGTKLLTSSGVVTTVTIGSYKDATKTYNTDASGTAANEDSYTMSPEQSVFQNDRVLGEISLSKVDLDAVSYVSDHGNANLENAVYDLYVAEDIQHPDGHTGVVDYSKIVDSEGNPIWHTTILDNAGLWVTDYLPVLRKDHLVASAQIKDGWLTFSNLYLGQYYLVERGTGVVIPVQEGAYVLSGSYPQVDDTKTATGGLIALGTNAAGQYTDWVYKNQFSSVSQSKALDGTKTYDGYSVSYAEGYLCDEQNHYITLTYETEGWYVEKTTFEDNRQPTGEEIDSTRYGANYHLHRSNDLAESQDQVMKANVQISKVVSSTGQSNGLDLEGAGFTFFLISDLSKADRFTVSNSGLYQLDSILAEYVNPAYTEDTPKYDFSGEAQAIAKTYEVAASEIEAYNWTLTAAGDYRNGSGNGWVSTGRPNEYQLSEIFSNDTGTLRVEGLPYGQYLCVETTTPKDVFQAQPFLVVVSPSDRNVPQSGMATPNAYAVPGSDSFLRYTILDEEIEAYLRITKIDDETGKPVLLADTAYQIYWLDEDGNYCLDSNGNPRRVVMTNTANGSLAKEVDTFYTTAEGVLTLPEKLPLGKYRIVELDGPNGFHNAWASAQQGAVDFEVTTDQAYQATGDKNENGQDTLVIQVDYHNNETLGVLTIRKTGEVLTRFENGSFLYEERPLAGAEYTITAAEDIYTQDRQQAADGSRTLWYAKGDVVAVVTTGGGETETIRYAPARTPAAYEFLSVIHDGTVGEVRVTLPLGSYHVEETKPPYGMVGTAQSYDVTFTWDEQTNDVVLASTIVNTPEDGEAVTLHFEVVSLQDASQDLVEQQVLTFRNEREKARVGVYKTDAETGAYLAGAVFDLYTREDLYDADGNLLLKAGEWVATSPETAADGATDFTCDLPIRGELYGKSDAKTAATNSGTYMIVESRAPQGYYLNAEPMEVSFTYDGQAVQVLESTCGNQPTEIWVSKRDLTNGEELPGASLSITDSEGNTVREWVSGSQPERITALHLEESYTLTETRPADGYALADSITFRLVQRKDDTGKLMQECDVYYLTTGRFLFWSWEDWKLLDDATVILCDDTIKVQISKKDLTNQEGLPGAHLTLTDAEGNVVDDWVSGTEPHYLEKLPAGQYTLTENTAPEGYAVAESVPIVVLPTGEIQSFEMLDDTIKVQISKQDITSKEELPGAHLTLTDAEGNVVDDWVSGTEPHYLEKLPAGQYTLTEVSAPAGYKVAESIVFTVAATGGVQHVTMYDEHEPAPTPAPTPTPAPDETPAPTPTPQARVPQTGDPANLALWVGLLAASLLGLAIGLTVAIRRRKNEKLPALPTQEELVPDDARQEDPDQ